MAEFCSCRATTRLIYACSGSADVGEVADRVARKLTRTGVGKMACLAGIGGGVEGILEQARAARAILAIDGCPSDCASASLQQAGFKHFPCVQLADLGLNKDESPATPETIERVVAVLASAFNERRKLESQTKLRLVSFHLFRSEGWSMSQSVAGSCQE